MKKCTLVLVITFLIIFGACSSAYADPGYDKVQAQRVPYGDEVPKLSDIINLIQSHRANNPLYIPYPAGTPTLDARIKQLKTLILMHHNGNLPDNDFKSSIETIKYSPNSILTTNGQYFQTIANLLQTGAINDEQAFDVLQKLELVIILEKVSQ
ncbi:hypothetical protein [Desulfallas thermosapovorans]|uniref:S-layer family protein n=1 Tax=Desulfallas thermosapovorans DSM 6562 TaxID=1121431 RepID=A0A5S4ZQL7_9FIRM|nr:hypothetical protein [Desulfallas thermosapovorans]TYO95158.1 hypothetical protein LX24_01887 [Desulfallas thermosapovorans DSM 6562]